MIFDHPGMLRCGRRAKLLATADRPVWEVPCSRKTTCSKKTGECLPASQLIALSRPGGYGGVAAPVPIPNTAVKRPSANGTSSQDAGE